MESDNNKAAGKVLVKDGQWCVPESERPRNWREILPEKEAAVSVREHRCRNGEPKQHQPITAPAQAEATPKRQQQFRGWVALRNAIRKSAKYLVVDAETLDAAFVLSFGMWSRDLDVIHARTGIVNPKPYIDRCLSSGLWLEDGAVELGEMNDDIGDIGFWCRAMVVSGILKIAYRDGSEPVFQLRNAA